MRVRPAPLAVSGAVPYTGETSAHPARSTPHPRSMSKTKRAKTRAARRPVVQLPVDFLKRQTREGRRRRQQLRELKAALRDVVALAQAGQVYADDPCASILARLSEPAVAALLTPHTEDPRP